MYLSYRNNDPTDINLEAIRRVNEALDLDTKSSADHNATHTNNKSSSDGEVDSNDNGTVPCRLYYKLTSFGLQSSKN